MIPLYYSSSLDCTLVECLPITGRTHQIRLHLKYLGHAIDDDFNYNESIHVPKWQHVPVVIRRRTFREWKDTPKEGDDSALTEGGSYEGS